VDGSAASPRAVILVLELGRENNWRVRKGEK
jgi:hypothetical protein